MLEKNQARVAVQRAVSKALDRSFADKAYYQGVTQEEAKRIYRTDDERAIRESEVSLETTTLLDEVKRKLEETSKQFKLEVLLLIYLFNEDDGKVSFSEKRALKNHFTLYKGRVTASVMTELKGLKDYNKLGEIHQFITKNDIPNETVKQSISTIQTFSTKKEEYASIIKKMKTVLLKV